MVASIKVGQMKRCTLCGEVKSLSEFYASKGMHDGYANQCKECVKERARVNRNKRLDAVRAYDRKRGNRQEKGYQTKYRESNPKKYKAHCMLNNALRDGLITKQPCCICGKEAVAHHDDYNFPLKVRWLCQSHHKQWHAIHGEGKI